MSALLYLASPYTHPSALVREQRYVAACKAAGKLMQEGHCVFSPIAHSHPIEQHFGRVEGHDFWLKQDFAILVRATKLVVLTLEGWERSRGIAAELEFATVRGIPLEFRDP